MSDLWLARIDSVAWANGRAQITATREADGVQIANIIGSSSHLAPQADERILIQRTAGTRVWVDVGCVTRHGLPVTKIGARIVSQSIATGSSTTCAFGASDVAVDSHGWEDNANNRVEPDIEGWYLLSGWAYTSTSLSDGVRATFNGRVGSSDFVAAIDNVQGAAAPWSGSIADVFYHDGTSADYVFCRIFHDQGSNVTFNWSYSVTLLKAYEL